MVFDASAKHNNKSLNYVIQNSLSDILTRFRREPVQVMCNISEMYLQIRLSAKDIGPTVPQVFVEKSGPQQATGHLQVSRVVFGVNSSPFMAQYVAQHHVRQFQNQYPKVAEIVLQSIIPGGGGGGALSIYTGGGVPRHIQKGGVLCMGTTPKKGGIRHGHNPIKGGLKHGHELKNGGLRHRHESKKRGRGHSLYLL